MVFVLLGVALISCGSPKVLVTGKVQRILGNQMPSPDVAQEEPAGYITTVYFFEPTLMSLGMPTGEQGVFKMTDKKLVAKALAGKDGRFKLKVKPGKYSVLMGKDGQYYSNISDVEGIINPIEININSKKPIILRADWGAIY